MNCNCSKCRGLAPPWQCTDKILRCSTIQTYPQRNAGYEYLNNMGVKPATCPAYGSDYNSPYNQKWRFPTGPPTCFDRVNCGCEGSNTKHKWVSHDPRLIDAPRAIRTDLDAPPFSGDIALDSIYDEQYRNYRADLYPSYASIGTGQIAYRMSLSPPYNDPNFVIPTAVDHILFKDPMGALKPQYNRRPLVKNNNALSNLSSIRDSMGFREDIMEGLYRKRREQDYETYYNQCTTHI